MDDFEKMQQMIMENSAMLNKKNDIVLEEPETEDVAENSEEVSNDTEVVSDDYEDNPKLVALAKKQGWKPRSEWDGTTEWVDPDTFLENKYSELKNRVKQTGKAAEEAVEELRRKMQAEYENELRLATISGDAEAAIAASRKIAQAQSAPLTPPQEVTKWQEKNSWYFEDPTLRQEVFNIAEVARLQGFSIPEQLNMVDTVMSKKYPHLYETTNVVAPKKTAPAVVQPGNRSGTTVQKKKDWNSLPNDVRKSLSPIARRLIADFPKVDEKTHYDNLAKSYYKDN